MKRFKIIACFLLMFSVTFSEESSLVAEQKARITQLEQQVETQNKIIARYEKLEDKLNDRVLETLELNNKVDDFYNSAWTKLENQNSNEIDSLKTGLKDKVNFVKDIVLGIMAIVGIIAIMPIYQSFKSRDVLKKIEVQEKALQDQSKEMERMFFNLNSLSSFIVGKELESKNLTPKTLELNIKVYIDSLMQTLRYALRNPGMVNICGVIKMFYDPILLIGNEVSNKEEIKMLVRKSLVNYRASDEYNYVVSNLDEIIKKCDSVFGQHEERGLVLKEIFI